MKRERTFFYTINKPVNILSMINKNKLQECEEDSVIYCTKCYSLKIKERESIDMDCCADCGCTDFKTASFDDWEKLYKSIAVKNITPAHYSNVKQLLERIAIHNMAFPSTAMTMRNVGTSDNGISIVVEQPLIKDSGDIPTYKEIEDYMSSLGFTLTKGSSYLPYKTDFHHKPYKVFLFL